jgi:hypothetical protein
LAGALMATALVDPPRCAGCPCGFCLARAACGAAATVARHEVVPSLGTDCKGCYQERGDPSHSRGVSEAGRLSDGGAWPAILMRRGMTSQGRSRAGNRPGTASAAG